MKQLDIIAELLRTGKVVKIPVRGNSMRPYLVHDRDFVILQKDEDMRVGDTVLAEISPSHYILHRIVNISGQNVTLRGDGNIQTENCELKDICGKVIAFVRKGRDSQESPDALSYRFYSWFWMHTLRLRRFMLELHNLLFRSCKNLERIVPTEDDISLFLEMIQSALWQKPVERDVQNISARTNGVIDQLAKEQTVEGLILNTIRDWDKIGVLVGLHIKENKVLHKVFGFLNDNGFSPILLKGQGNAARYPEPQQRQCGDIDIYIGKKDYKRACGCIDRLIDKKRDTETSESPKHYHVKYEKITIEIHRIAENQPNWFINHRFQQLTEKWLVADMADSVNIAGRDVPVPPRQFNVLYVFNHMWHHLLSSGIGLRQVCDWTMLLHEAYGKLDLKELEHDLRRNHLFKPWQIMGPIVVQKLGLPANEMPFLCDRYEKESQLAWDTILEGGNFGRHKDLVYVRYRRHWVLGKIRSLIIHLLHSIHLYALAGVEVIIFENVAYFCSGVKRTILRALGISKR